MCVGHECASHADGQAHGIVHLLARCIVNMVRAPHWVWDRLRVQLCAHAFCNADLGCTQLLCQPTQRSIAGVGHRMLAHALERLEDALHIAALGGQLLGHFERYAQRFAASPAALNQIFSGDYIVVIHNLSFVVIRELHKFAPINLRDSRITQGH